MSFFETIKIKNGRVYNQIYHQNRVDRTTKRFNIKQLDLIRSDLDLSKDSRCKIVYGKEIKISYSDLISRDIKKLKLIQSDLDYTFKSTDRSDLDTIYKARSDCDDILIVKNGFITDTTIANIAFFDGVRWITPRVPLLKGTIRARLIAGSFLHPQTIKQSDLKPQWRVALMNAIIGFMIIGTVGEVIEEI